MSVANRLNEPAMISSRGVQAEVAAAHDAGA